MQRGTWVLRRPAPAAKRLRNPCLHPSADDAGNENETECGERHSGHDDLRTF